MRSPAGYWSQQPRCGTQSCAGWWNIVRKKRGRLGQLIRHWKLSTKNGLCNYHSGNKRATTIDGTGTINHQAGNRPANAGRKLHSGRTRTGTVQAVGVRARSGARKVSRLGAAVEVIGTIARTEHHKDTNGRAVTAVAGAAMAAGGGSEGGLENALGKAWAVLAVPHQPRRAKGALWGLGKRPPSR